MDTPFIYRNKEYSLESVLLHLLRREINNYGRSLSGIIYSLSTQDSTDNNGYVPNPTAWTEAQQVASEIQSIQRGFYFNKFKNSNDINSIYKKLKNRNNGKSYRIYDYFDLNGMYGYYLLTKSIVEQYNGQKITIQNDITLSESEKKQKLYALYKYLKEINLLNINEKFPYYSIHSDLKKEPIVANKQADNKIEAMYQWLGLPYSPDLLSAIIDTYRENPTINKNELLEKVSKIQQVDEVLQQNQSSNNQPQSFQNEHGEDLGPGEPYYEKNENGESVLTGYLTGDGTFFPVDIDVTATPASDEEDRDCADSH